MKIFCYPILFIFCYPLDFRLFSRKRKKLLCSWLFSGLWSFRLLRSLLLYCFALLFFSLLCCFSSIVSLLLLLQFFALSVEPTWVSQYAAPSPIDDKLIPRFLRVILVGTHYLARIEVCLKYLSFASSSFLVKSFIWVTIFCSSFDESLVLQCSVFDLDCMGICFAEWLSYHFRLHRILQSCLDSKKSSDSHLSVRRIEDRLLFCFFAFLWWQ